MIRPLLRPAACLAVSLLCCPAARAQGTHLWSQSTAGEWERGTPEGASISSLGRLAPGPSVRQVVLTGSTFVWSLAADHAGDAYLATGSPAGVLRVTPEGVQKRIFSTKDLAVQVVRIGPDGAVYAATLPSGRVYRVDPAAVDQDETKAALVFDPAQTAEKPKYVWDLAFDAQGRLYVATGAPGGVYRVATPGKAGAAKPELFFASDEPHMRVLAFDKAGALYAGSDGSGLVYRIAPDGKGFVLYEAGKREVTALALGPAGQLYVAAVGERGRSPLPPLPVQGVASVTATITVVQPGSVQAFNGNTVLPDGSEIDELSPAGVPRRLWTAHDDIVYALHRSPEGLLAASGNRGRVYRIAEDGSFEDVAHLLASQVTGFAEGPSGLYAATASTGKLYLLSPEEKTPHTFTSEVFDAQVHSTWGRLEVLGGGSYDLLARTGNVENPLRGWTEWVPVTPNAPAAQLMAARYIQWKAVLRPGATISSVSVNYLPANIAPIVDDIVVVPGTRANASSSQPQIPQQTSISFGSQANNQGFDGSNSNGPLAAVRDKAAVTARWAAHDDNGDELTYALYYRAEGGGGDTNWRLLKDKLTERFYTFDASLLPDGAYRLKVVASDAPSHLPADALEAQRESASFLIDTATPQVTALAAAVDAAGLHVTATATDPATPIARAEYSLDAGPWQYAEPVGRLSDALVEHYDFTLPLPAATGHGEHSITLRVFDRYDNAGSAKATAH